MHNARKTAGWPHLIELRVRNPAASRNIGDTTVSVRFAIQGYRHLIVVHTIEVLAPSAERSDMLKHVARFITH